MDMNDAIKIQVTKIIGTKITAYSAWEPEAGHSTITHIDGVRYGRVGTSKLPTELAALKPGSDERYERVHTFFNADKERAYAAILAQHPEAATGQRDGMGEIEVISK